MICEMVLDIGFMGNRTMASIIQTYQRFLKGVISWDSLEQITAPVKRGRGNYQEMVIAANPES
jgi:hypothetical protein